MKSKLRSRIMSLFMAITLFLVGLPFATNAAEETTGTQTTQTEPNALPTDPIIGDELISDEIISDDLIELEPIIDPNDGKIVAPEVPEGDASTLAINTAAEYYLAVKSNGDLITYPPLEGTPRLSRYSDVTDHFQQKWTAVFLTNGNFYMYPSAYYPTQVLLTVNPETKQVYTTDYALALFDYQCWKQVGDYLVCQSTDTSVNGLKLEIVYNPYGAFSSVRVSATGTPLYNFRADTYVAPTALQIKSTLLSNNRFYIAPKENRTITFTSTPTNATVIPAMLSWTYSQYISFNASAMATGKKAGTANAVAIDLITDVIVVFPFTVTVMPEGRYYFENGSLSNYMQIDNNAAGNDYLTNKAILEQWAYDGADYQKWQIISLHNGYYKILSVESGKALSVQANKENLGDDNSTIVQETYATLNRQHWLITTTTSGNYKLKAKSSEAYTTDWCLAAGTSLISDPNGRNVEQRAYSDDTNLLDEWLLLPCIYGTQTFRELDSSQWDDINCHGYAMMRNDEPADWCILSEEYMLGVIKPSTNDYSPNTRRTLALRVKQDFEKWLDKNDYTYIPETDFSGNGESRTLQDNQYRVVLRVGLHNITHKKDLDWDYHFWYQTYDGRWANKHGEAAPELLPEGTTPYTVGSSGWTFSYDGQVYTDFYDSERYFYIITIN